MAASRSLISSNARSDASSASRRLSRCSWGSGGSSRAPSTPRKRLRSVVVDPRSSTSATSTSSSSLHPLLTSPRSNVAHFVNLTNGLEAVPTLLSLGIRDFTLVRLPSTACEQRRFGDFLSAVDVSLLAAAASGRVVLVWDTSSRDRGGIGSDDVDEEWEEALLNDDDGAPRAGGGLRCPRALFWGLELLRFACERAWREGRKPRAILGEAGHDVSSDFEDALRGRGDNGGGVSEATKARFRYFRRFCREGKDVKIWGCYRPSRLDDGGGGNASKGAQRELFELAVTTRASDGSDAASLSPPPPFSRDALAKELASLGWGLFSGGEDRAERLRASRKRRNEKGKRKEEK